MRDEETSTTSCEEPPWYCEGLRLACTRCGRCCRGPGNVWVSDLEIEALAVRAGIPAETFRRTHARRSGQHGWVLRQKRNEDCIFWLNRGGCLVYEDRPQQCRTYPLWKANLTTEEVWEREARSCPGIGSGPLHPLTRIEATIENDGIPEQRTRLRQQSNE
ncbi:MAG: YkgJ family cysteine cluster protein [bacterium]|nr:YkgJ family cysteine cluster protein [bacterium]